jgi:Tol biopolymer transport system component
VWIVSADGGDPHEITHGIGTVRAPSWSPDGTKIVYSEGGVGQHDLYTVDVEGGATTPLLTSPGNDRGPTWCCY